MGEKCDHRLGSGKIVRQYQVAHQQAALRDAVCVEPQIADLAIHFAHGGEVDLDVIAYMGILVGNCRITVFHVRHVYIDDPVEQLQCLGAVVAAGVVDQWQAQSLVCGNIDRGNDLRHDVAGRDEIDVVTTLFLQLQHHFGECLRRYLVTCALLTDVPVLAENAAQVAPAEKNRARSPRTA